LENFLKICSTTPLRSRIAIVFDQRNTIKKGCGSIDVVFSRSELLIRKNGGDDEDSFVDHMKMNN